jgi:hypothetical protein
MEVFSNSVAKSAVWDRVLSVNTLDSATSAAHPRGAPDLAYVDSVKQPLAITFGSRGHLGSARFKATLPGTRNHRQHSLQPVHPRYLDAGSDLTRRCPPQVMSSALQFTRRVQDSLPNPRLFDRENGVEHERICRTRGRVATLIVETIYRIHAGSRTLPCMTSSSSFQRDTHSQHASQRCRPQIPTSHQILRSRGSRITPSLSALRLCAQRSGQLSLRFVPGSRCFHWPLRNVRAVRELSGYSQLCQLLSVNVLSLLD